MSQTETSTTVPVSSPAQSLSNLIPPWAFVVLGVVSAEVGAGFAKELFAAAGTSGVVFIRTLIAALLFNIIWRPKVFGYTRKDYLYVLAYGATIAIMMLTFYVSISRIPLGVSVAICFCGPLGLALITSRRMSDVVWVIAAGFGVLLLSPFTNSSIDPVGVLFAIISGITWAVYSVVAGRASKAFPNNGGLAIGMTIAALIAMPFGLEGATHVLSSPGLAALGVFVALLSSALPFAAQYQALKLLPARVFGILSSLEPVVALVVGAVMLHEALVLREVVGIVLVTIAAAATARSSK